MKHAITPNIVSVVLLVALLASSPGICFSQAATQEPDAWAELVPTPVPGAPVSTSAATPTRVPSTPAAAGPAIAAEATPTVAPTALPVAEPDVSGRIAFTVFNPSLSPAACDLYIANADGSDRRLLARGACQPDVRSDGLILARGSDSLYLIDSATAEKENISPFGSDAWPSWAPEPGTFVFVNGGDHSVIVQDWPHRDGIRTTLHFGMPSLAGNTPAWLPDGRIVYNGCNVWENSGSCGLYAVDRFGGAPVQLTADPTDLAPDAFEDRVVFMSRRDGNWEIYQTGRDGGDVARLTDDSAADGLPVWSPDGGSIAFVSNRGGAWAVWRMNSDGSDQELLFELGGPPGQEWTQERISWVAAKQP